MSEVRDKAVAVVSGKVGAICTLLREVMDDIRVLSPASLLPITMAYMAWRTCNALLRCVCFLPESQEGEIICPLCAKILVDKRDGCRECGVFWCYRCHRWRGWTVGSDGRDPFPCDDCRMPMEDEDEEENQEEGGS